MFRDRVDAGRRLGARLRDHPDLAAIIDARHATEASGAAESLPGSPVVVAGLPRGGVPVAVEVGRALAAPVDVILVRKVGVPWHPELAMGAVGEDDVVVVNDDVVRSQRVSDEQFEAVAQVERAELARRARQLRGERSSHPLTGRVVVIVDDGIATGATAHAACDVARVHGAAAVVLAVPVAPPGWDVDLAGVADLLVAIDTPRSFQAVGAHYQDFHAVSDREVAALLEAADRSG
jgi:putative phosphoribosyl transferase